ncbi:hypothetical protein [Methanocella conradii]|uniref:hypothetical protein n=1 Tax=Methanocella conradii TaxID=1175444 RepID=UPI00157CDF93|nr:hypothetical protein [Methanocella conradii]
MELPHGVLVKSFKGPTQLAGMNSSFMKEAFTGFMRVSIVKGSFAEGVIVYEGGKPVIAYTSDGKNDRPDEEQKGISQLIENEDSVIELFSLTETQVRLILDFSKDLMIRRQPAPPPKPPVETPRPMPVQKPKPQEKPVDLPQVRGTFVRSESFTSLRSYIDSRKDETGHATIAMQDGAVWAEYHLLFLHGKLVAAYSSSPKEKAGTALLNNIIYNGGVAEFYRVEDAIINSILRMYPNVAITSEKAQASDATPKAEPRPMQVLRPEQIARPDPAMYGPTIKPPGKLEPAAPKAANALSEKADRHMYSVEGGMGTPAPAPRSTGTLKGDMDDDVDFVKKVEKEFMGNVDDLLNRLDLSHLKVVPDKKKRI